MVGQLAKEVVELLDYIRSRIEGSEFGYIFRGEPKRHGRISSSLYREYEDDIEARRFGIEDVQREIAEDVGDRFGEKDTYAVLEQLQHYGGKTNRIDFSTDYLVALFFACDEEPDSDGRLIFLNKGTYQAYKTYKPVRPQSRVVAQKSIFVIPTAGYIDDGLTEDIVTIPKGLKQKLLDYLMKHHDIHATTIYNDIHGYINQSKIHDEAYANYYRGRTHDSRGEHEEAKISYDKLREIKSQLFDSHLMRGNERND